ncbi:hypothetical protein HYDPIDRAFT_114025 [Hydnomerulius pinastri MD-312]|uniref:Uncharacterized protein n=1 Tax=Hydnomerulius pinastri MD-312 TaxID=994086 RepID=A0A0C9VXC9_9AGAM|nr:hypothetical protein HYDPIDRAFT_114025 [Hydnomerulius pinastri MD-312]
MNGRGFVPSTRDVAVSDFVLFLESRKGAQRGIWLRDSQASRSAILRFANRREGGEGEPGIWSFWEVRRAIEYLGVAGACMEEHGDRNGRFGRVGQGLGLAEWAEGSTPLVLACVRSDVSYSNSAYSLPWSRQVRWLKAPLQCSISLEQAHQSQKEICIVQ